MESKKKEIEVRELAEQFFEEAVNQLDDKERKEEIEAERETYIGVWMRGYRAGESTPAGINQDAHEKEIIMQAFDKVRQIFEGRQWVMEGRGSYPYNDDRYKEEVRYMYDEFDEVAKDTWANIKSKSVEYREKIIAEYLHGDHPAIHDILRRIGYQRIDTTPAGREEGTDVFVPCAEDDPDRCGGYTSDDGRSLCYVKVQHVPVSALKQKEGK